MAVSTYSATSAGRLNSSGRLRREPEFWLGSKGKVRASQNTRAAANAPITRNVVRQPMASPSRRPRGIPSTIARDVPVASRPRACTCLPSGARRTARDAVIDQNSAWDKAMPTRLTINRPKLVATLERIWLAINRQNSTISSLRRSTLRVSSITGSEVRDTIQA